MLTQGQTEGLTLMSERAFADLENRIMSDIVNRLKINGSSTATTDWQITRLQQYGISERDITAWIAEAMQTTDAETKKMLSDTLYQEYNKQKRFYKIEGAKQIPFKENEPIQNLIKATTAQTHGTFQNITQSMGFAMKDPAGKMRYQSLRNFYTQTLDNAMMDIESGAFSYNTVLERTINTMTNSGLRYIDYASGVSSRIEVAVRRALMTGYGQVQRYMSDQIADELGTEYFEVSAHSGARPEHEEWQGGVYTKDELYSICGLDDALGLCGINCYHSYDPFFPGISKRRYTDEQLEALKAEDAKEIEFNGKKYNKYQALQEQRKMERQMRKYRQDIDLLKKGEADAETIEAKQIKYQTKYSQYKSFSDRMELPMQRDRIYNDGLSIKGSLNYFETPYIEYRPLQKAADSISDSLKSSNDKWMKKVYNYHENTYITQDIELPTAFAYNRKLDMIMYNPKHPQYECYDSKYALIHELSHRIDQKEIQSWSNKEFQVAIQHTADNLLNNKTLRAQIEKELSDDGKYSDNIAFHDLIDALTKGKIKTRVSHETDYWRNDSARSAEIFAELSTGKIQGEDFIDEGFLNNLVKIFKVMIYGK